jgi:D-glycero-D-manno-heptose 1,7-bisphosphate phosphatase
VSLWLPSTSPLAGKVPEVAVPAERVLFLDRDGVVIEDRHYISQPRQVELIPGAAVALMAARAAGFHLVGVSNQSGIGRGLYTTADFQAVQSQLDRLLAEAGVSFDALFYCPHAPDDHCSCRKPAPGLLQEAGRLFTWSTERSWLVGDKAADMALAQAAGLGAVMVRTGQGERELSRLREPELAHIHVVSDLGAAVALILERERS